MSSSLAFLAVGNVIAAFAMVVTLVVMSRDLKESPIRGIYNAQLAGLTVSILCFFALACGWFE